MDIAKVREVVKAGVHDKVGYRHQLIGASAADADDATQDATVRLLQNPRFREAERPLGMARIAGRNAALDLLKLNAHETAADQLPDEDDENPRESESITNVPNRLRWFAGSIDDLLEFLLLYIDEDDSDFFIAYFWGKTPRTVKERLRFSDIQKDLKQAAKMERCIADEPTCLDAAGDEEFIEAYYRSIFRRTMRAYHEVKAMPMDAEHPQDDEERELARLRRLWDDAAGRQTINY